MQTFNPGTAALLSFSLLDEVGNAFTPTSLRWRITDESENVLRDWLVVAVPASEDLPLTIPAALTTLTPPATRSLRTIELEMTSAVGVLTLSESALIRAGSALVLGVNTFQTYGEALLRSQDMLTDSLEGWSPETRVRREMALSEAYQRIMQLPLAMRFADEQNTLTQDASYIRSFGGGMVRELSPAQIAALYPPMLKDLRQAQLIEANEILSGDEIRTARAKGISSITVGESSHFFRGAQPLDFPVCERTMKHLQRWVRFGARLVRS